MALKEPFAIKTRIGDGDLELTADPGESLLVKDILIHNPATNYATLKIEKTTVGFFRVGGILGSHLPFSLGKGQHSHDIRLDHAGITVAETVKSINAGGAIVDPSFPLATAITVATTYPRIPQLSHSLFKPQTILSFLREKGFFVGYPIGEGETFLISGVGQAGAIQTVIYEIYDAGDQVPTAPNGSLSTEYLFINYGNGGADINITGDTLFINSISPPEFPAFPFGVEVPAKTEIDLIGILGSDFAPGANNGINYTYTEYLKFIRERIVLFDEDRKGLLFYAPFATAPGNMNMIGEGYSLIGNFSDVDSKPPFLFPTPLTFSAGEELGIYYTTFRGGAGQPISTAAQEIGLILRVRKVT